MRFHPGDIIEMIYMDASGRLTQRHVRVVSVQDARLVAFCYLRREVRCFVIANILGAVKVGEWHGSKAV
jgi:predicted DNA-binding transcriptional regulator YafY